MYVYILGFRGPQCRYQVIDRSLLGPLGPELRPVIPDARLMQLPSVDPHAIPGTVRTEYFRTEKVVYLYVQFLGRRTT